MNPRRRLVGLGIAITLFVLMALPTSTVSAATSQIVLACSSTGVNGHGANECVPSGGPFGHGGFVSAGGELDFVFGFWIWCQSPTNPTPYGLECAGAVYTGEITLVTGAFAYEVTSLDGTAASATTVTFTPSDGDYTCMLTLPSSPAAGPANTVIATCGGVSGISFSNVDVQVT